MVTVTASEARNNFKHFLDLVNDNAEEVHVTRERGRNAVLIGEDDWNSIQETLRIYEDPQVCASVKESLAQFEQGDTVVFDSLDQLRERHAL
jgi:prevent-host-death family protein